MRKALAMVSAALVMTWASFARADAMPSGYKKIKLSIRVEAEVPAGQTLVLSNTFPGLDLITPGTVALVEWHPLGGPMQIGAVPTSLITSSPLEELRKNRKYDVLRELFKKGKPCIEPFEGFRVAPRSAPADEIRWNYKVTFSGNACKATLVSMEFFDVLGKATTAMDIEELPAGIVIGAPGTDPATAPKTVYKPDPMRAEYVKDNESPLNRACGCEVYPGDAEFSIRSLGVLKGIGAAASIVGLVLRARRGPRRRKTP